MFIKHYNTLLLPENEVKKKDCRIQWELQSAKDTIAFMRL